MGTREWFSRTRAGSSSKVIFGGQDKCITGTGAFPPGATAFYVFNVYNGIESPLPSSATTYPPIPNTGMGVDPNQWPAQVNLSPTYLLEAEWHMSMSFGNLIKDLSQAALNDNGSTFSSTTTTGTRTTTAIVGTVAETDSNLVPGTSPNSISGTVTNTPGVETGTMTNSAPTIAIKQIIVLAQPATKRSMLVHMLIIGLEAADVTSVTANEPDRFANVFLNMALWSDIGQYQSYLGGVGFPPVGSSASRVWPTVLQGSNKYILAQKVGFINEQTPTIEWKGCKKDLQVQLKTGDTMAIVAYAIGWGETWGVIQEVTYINTAGHLDLTFDPKGRAALL